MVSKEMDAKQRQDRGGIHLCLAQKRYQYADDAGAADAVEVDAVADADVGGNTLTWSVPPVKICLSVCS